ncbi:uncharacterized protein LOC106635916 [Copidosoma floridanum]|uniref:uncharacterized protein LOC106635916 n=1 Tax=Copidosoma floridanum TaxID=29053 RepID=UPI0006C9D34B|nr:uncharacterized protein LOC106635916 [Copidosoma floridanum]
MMLEDESVNVDINEAFEKILLAEDLAEQTAYKEGFDSGKRQMLQGYHLGYHRASSIAAQLGYYLGILLYIKQFVTNIPKISQQTSNLIRQIQTFPSHNDDKLDIAAEFESIKLHVKKICSLAKIDPKYPECDQTDF